MSISTVTSKGQITLPKDIRLKLHLEKGEKVDFQINEKNGTATLIPLTRRVNDVFGILKNKKQKKIISVEEMDNIVKAKIKDSAIDRP